MSAQPVRRCRRLLGVLVLFLTVVSAPAAAAVPGHGRVWELVTPPDSPGVFAGVRGWDASGDRVVYVTLGPLPGSPAGEVGAHDLAVREADGWRNMTVTNPYSVETPVLVGEQPVAITRDLSTWWWESGLALLPGAPAAPDTGLYRRELAGGLTLLGNAGSRGAFEFQGGSEDGRHAVFRTTDRLLEADNTRAEGHGVYEFDGPDLRLVSAAGDGSLLSTCGTTLAGPEPLHPISRDGRRILLTTPDSASSCTQPRRLYVREDGAVTKEVSASHCNRPDCDAPQDVVLAGATPDGSSVFMTTTQQLTNDDVDSNRDLYRYDVDSGTLTRVSAGPPGEIADAAQTVVQTSDDGTRVYFIAGGVLVPGEGGEGAKNLYLAEGDSLRFVGQLDSSDGWLGGGSEVFLTPDGGRLLLASYAKLDPGDTDTRKDVYLYSADGDTLTRLSAGGPDGGNGAFDASLGQVQSPLIGQTLRYITEDGRRAFFSTDEPLVPEDGNELADVYEWAEGSLGLVSSGAQTNRLSYAGVSADGRSVFLTTDEALTPDDTNGDVLDLYAARLGGGFPPKPSPPPLCAGDVCQGAPAGRLSRPPAASTRERGAEDLLDRLRLRPIGAAARRRIAATGRMTLVAEAPAPGRLSVLVRARIGRTPRTVARAGATVARAGTVRLRLRLSAPARRELRRRRTLRLRLVLRHSRLGAAPTTSMTLRGAR